jgi:hypothetical protein
MTRLTIWCFVAWLLFPRLVRRVPPLRLTLSQEVREDGTDLVGI